MNVFLDTNVLMDVLLDREPFVAMTLPRNSAVTIASAGNTGSR